jgi:hypothetical protein
MNNEAIIAAAATTDFTYQLITAHKSSEDNYNLVNSMQISNNLMM